MHSIIYRDLKPDNIAIDGGFRVKIFDFGTAKELKPNACRGPNRFAVTGRTGTEAVLARKQNAATIANSSVKMKFPENSPYNVGKSQKEFKPTQNRKELLHNAKKAEF